MDVWGTPFRPLAVGTRSLCGDRCSVVDGKAGLSSRDLVFVSKGKITFTSFLLLSLLRPNSPCATMTFW